MKSEVPLCIIDDDGRFKYIQIKETSKEDKDYERILIRGSKDSTYHKDMFYKFMNGIDEKSKFDYAAIGGGKIERQGNKIFIFGFSQAYGQCDHEVTVKILTEKYGNMYNISSSNEGY